MDGIYTILLYFKIMFGNQIMGNSILIVYSQEFESKHLAIVNFQGYGQWKSSFFRFFRSSHLIGFG